MLSAAPIIAQAEDLVGISDSDRAVRVNLERLLDSLNRNGNLSADGAALTQRHLTNDTVNRLEGLKWLRDYPEIADEPIAAPVFLMGLPRSGTTYFQYLFDRDPRFRLIRTWESLTPSPPPGFDHASALRRRAEWAERRRREHPTFEGFDALHLIDEGGSDECHAFLEQSFGAAGLQNLFRVPDYFDYIMDELDLVETYRIHKRQLQLLQWRSPPRPWALKYPNHVIAMNEILEVYPDARFVMTHRDPIQTLASISKMTFNLRGVRTGNAVDPTQVGSEMMHFVQRHIDRIMEFDRSKQGGRVVHVDYYALVDDPVTALRRIFDGLGIDSPDEVVEAVRHWWRANPKNARGRNEYTLEQWGLKADTVAEQFGEYMRRFDIPREKDGLARVAV
jgi:sulfotransferase family protein